jgi:hypothetical protein
MRVIEEVHPAFRPLSPSLAPPWVPWAAIVALSNCLLSAVPNRSRESPVDHAGSDWPPRLPERKKRDESSQVAKALKLGSEVVHAVQLPGT